MKLTYHPFKLLLASILLFSSFSITAQKDDFTIQKVLIDGQLQEVYELSTQQQNITVAPASLLAVGDDCNNPITVTINGDGVQKALTGATISGITPPCATTNSVYDTWFIAQTDANGTLDIDFNTTNNEAKEFGITLWTDCMGSSRSCDDAPTTISGIGYSPNSNLEPNQTIYIQIWTYTPSTQEIIIKATSYCNILFSSTTLGEQTCNAETGTYTQEVSVMYYTVLETNPTIVVKNSNFQTIYSIQATSNPQVITIPDLPANGVNQNYNIGLEVCNSTFEFNWQAPNSDCSPGTSGGSGGSCSEAVSIAINSGQSCIDLQTSNFSGWTPPCSEGGNMKDAWFKATADDIGSLSFEYHAADFSDLMVGYTLVDDCSNPSVSFCSPPPSFITTFFSINVPAQYRVANKTWYLQIWSPTNQAQEICVEAKPDCGITEIELGMAECTDNQTFSQVLTITSFNVSGGMIRVVDRDNDFMTILETPYISNPQTITVSGLNASAESINLIAFSSQDGCYGSSVAITPPDCSQGNNCPTDRTISGSLDLMTYRAANNIITEGAIIVSSDTDFKAGTSITLTTDFQVTKGASFSASIEDCPDTGMIVKTTENSINESKIASLSTTPLLAENRLHIFPNPFSTETTIEYQLANAGLVHITLFDITGKQLKILNNSFKEKGVHQLTLAAENLIPGMYFLRANLNNSLQTKKIYLSK